MTLLPGERQISIWVPQYAGRVTYPSEPYALAVTLGLLEIPRLSFDPIARQTRSVGSEAENGTT